MLVVLASLAGARWVEFQRRAVEQIMAAAGDQHAAYVRESAAWLDRHGAVGRGAPQTPMSVYWMRGFTWLTPRPEGVLTVGQGDLRPYYTAVNTTRAPAWLCGLTLVAAWVLIVFLAPTPLHAASERRHPLPSRTQQVMAATGVRQQVDATRPAHLVDLLRERPELATPGDPVRRGDTPDWYPAFIAYQIALEREDARDEARFRAVLEAREEVAHRLRFLAPSVLVQRAAQRVAGSSIRVWTSRWRATSPSTPITPSAAMPSSGASWTHGRASSAMRSMRFDELPYPAPSRSARRHTSTRRCRRWAVI